MISVEEYEFVVDLAADMIGYVPEYFRDKWKLDDDLAQAQAVLIREKRECE